MELLQNYLRELHFIRGTGAGVAETSYYGALGSLLNGAGAQLKPSVRCLLTLKNQGAGLPDGGFFTTDQMGKAADSSLLPSLLPARGVLEVKGTGADIAQIVGSAQVQKYWEHYGQVLVTNLRDWALVGRDSDGNKTVMEHYRLAVSEEAFWKSDPAALAAAHGDSFIEYLKRALLQAAPLQSPEDVAWFLASYARDAKSRVEHANLPALQSVRGALEQALGLEFTGPRGEHFFRSTLIQTLFYGVFSAWVLWCNQHASTKTAGQFNWKMAAWELHVPMIRALFEEVAKPSNLGPLGLVEVLDWTGAALNRVDQAAFFAKFDTGQAVQYFYEPFLQAFDPELRKDLGVWYTPPEIVRYMVARVDTALKTELDIPDGLADPRVYVLDPCCGTGAYLVETLRHIQATLDANGGDALAASDLKKAATERVFGFEILPAPFVVAHLQLGLLLQQAGAPLADTERAGVFLTNALTGWEPSPGPKQHLLYPELEAERDAADRVKQQTPILVILGNPPYNSFAGVAVSEERILSTAYRTTKNAPAPQGQGLNDLYIRFFRMAERRITEQTGQGIVCFISNYSWLDGLSHTGMRERYLEAFDDIWVDNLNGDKYKTGKVTPEGLPDPSVFSTDFNREGIQVGTAVALLVRKKDHHDAQTVHFHNWWGKGKRADLLASLDEDPADVYEPLKPDRHDTLVFAPLKFSDDYNNWSLLTDLFPISFPGVQSKRDEVVVDIDQPRLMKRMEQYFDPSISNEQMRTIFPRALESTGQFDAPSTRDYLVQRGFKSEYVVRYCYRPFDLRWIYWEPETGLLGRKSPDYFPQIFAGNIWIEARQKQPMAKFDRGFPTRILTDNFGNGFSSFFPMLIRQTATKKHLFDDETASDAPRFNLSDKARAYLTELGIADPEADPEQGSLLLYHTLAILHAPAYREENAGALRQDWPRISLPATQEALEASAKLGRQVAALLDTEQDVPGVTSGTLRPELKLLGSIQRVGGGALQPQGGDLRVAAGWGHAGQGGVSMPGKGKAVGRAWTDAERQALADGAAALNLTPEQAASCLGETTYAVYLNADAYWSHVPARVWEYTIGGYQVLKKWLSYREHTLLGRDLTPDEARYVTQTVRRLAALRLLEPMLDQNYTTVKAATWIAASHEDALLDEYHDLADMEIEGELSPAQTVRLRDVQAQLDAIDAQDPQEQAIDARLRGIGERLDAILDELASAPEKVS